MKKKNKVPEYKFQSISQDELNTVTNIGAIEQDNTYIIGFTSNNSEVEGIYATKNGKALIDKISDKKSISIISI